MKIGDTIVPWLRNMGESFGLQYPYIVGFVGSPRKAWSIWNRHTGEVVWIDESEPPPENSFYIVGRFCASRKCRELNGISDDPVEQARINAEHDMEA